MLIAFALSGLGSTLRLGWEERMSVQGVERTAVCAGTAYLLGFLLFALISLLPALSVLAVLARAAAVRRVRARSQSRVRGRTETGASEVRMLPASLDGDSLRVSLSRCPLKPMAAISLAFFGYGATRANGVIGGFEVSSEFHGAGRRACAASFVAILLAYLFIARTPCWLSTWRFFDGYGPAAPGIA